jgi:N-glycosylase/DNA lyase
MISNICQRFGERIKFEGVEYNLFPSPKALASASIQELVGCGLGYRARFVKSVSRAVYEGDIDMSELLLHDYSEARDLLLRKLFGKKLFLGIGPKVADCVLLFSCEKVETFPIDVWIARTILRYYSNLLEQALRKKFESRLSKKVTLTLKEYDLITLQMKNYFGKYAGYAQQYLYTYSRIKVP